MMLYYIIRKPLRLTLDNIIMLRNKVDIHCNLIVLYHLQYNIIMLYCKETTETYSHQPYRG